MLEQSHTQKLTSLVYVRKLNVSPSATHKYIQDSLSLGGMQSGHTAMCACFSSHLYTLLSVYTQNWQQCKASLPHVHKHTRLIEPSGTHLVNCQSFSYSVAKLMSGTRVPEVPITLHCRNLYSSPVHFH